ncbi:MAG: protein O-GlcNAcase [Planctomycetes bacterium]|nr:protein O-GlcNAcase [Planctomycetota bacterium]
MNGLVEGFYGRPWPHDRRLALLDRLTDLGLDAYVYAPKDDDRHRARWRAPYDEAEAGRLGELARAAGARGVRFVHALAPGLDVRHADPGDLAALVAKLRQVSDLGAQGLALLFDDIPPRLHPDDERRFGSLARAQAHLVLEAWRALGEPPLVVCPTEYCGDMTSGSTYLAELGALLPPAIDLLWTGPHIVSETLTAAHVREVAQVLGRPPVLWDNLFADDYDMRRLHLGPYAGREPALRDEVRGVLLNPGCSVELVEPALATFAAWRRGAADPRAAWREALEAWRPLWTVGGAPLAQGDLVRFADCFYLPGRAGDTARAWWDDVAFLVAHPPDAWGERAERFLAAAADLVALCDRLAALDRRELLYAIYRHAWELKEELLLLEAWARWRRDHPAEPLRHPNYRAPIYRGALLSRLRSLLVQRPDGSLDARAP